MEFSRSKSQNKHLILFTNLFKKWVEIKPVRSARGKAVSKAFEELILFHWRTQEYILSDNEKEFLGMLKSFILRTNCELFLVLYVGWKLI